MSLKKNHSLETPILGVDALKTCVWFDCILIRNKQNASGKYNINKGT